MGRTQSGQPELVPEPGTPTSRLMETQRRKANVFPFQFLGL